MSHRLVYVLALLATGAHGPRPATGGRLDVEARAGATTCYVGQTVELSIRVVAGREPPAFEAPDVPGAALSHAGTDVSPVSPTGGGDAPAPRALYRARYRLVPRRAGSLTVPPFRARAGDDRGASRPLTLTVKTPPQGGRPAAFLGGVGRFAVAAEAEPRAVRLGETVEYRVTVRGPAARGVTAAPDVSRVERLTPAFRVERRPDVAVDDPPSHTFVYRLRPTRAGEATLPPVRVAAFDPSASVYVTRATAGVPVRVADVPRFDPSRLVVPAGGPATSGTGASPWGVAAGPAAVLVAAAVAAAVVTGRRRGRPARERARLCRTAAARLPRLPDDAARGRAIADALAEYLARAVGRPAGALTPTEARKGVARATGSDALAGRAEALVVLTDAARFGPPDAPAADLAAEGVRFFGDLAAAKPAAPETR